MNINQLEMMSIKDKKSSNYFIRPYKELNLDLKKNRTKNCFNHNYPNEKLRLKKSSKWSFLD